MKPRLGQVEPGQVPDGCHGEADSAGPPPGLGRRVRVSRGATSALMKADREGKIMAEGLRAGDRQAVGPYRLLRRLGASGMLREALPQPHPRDQGRQSRPPAVRQHSPGTLVPSVLVRSPMGRGAATAAGSSYQSSRVSISSPVRPMSRSTAHPFHRMARGNRGRRNAGRCADRASGRNTACLTSPVALFRFDDRRRSRQSTICSTRRRRTRRPSTRRCRPAPDCRTPRTPRRTDQRCVG